MEQSSTQIPRRLGLNHPPQDSDWGRESEVRELLAHAALVMRGVCEIPS